MFITSFWDCTDDDGNKVPTGKYQFGCANATFNDAQVPVKTLKSAIVNSVSMKEENLILMLASVSSFHWTKFVKFLININSIMEGACPFLKQSVV